MEVDVKAEGMEGILREILSTGQDCSTSHATINGKKEEEEDKEEEIRGGGGGRRRQECGNRRRRRKREGGLIVGCSYW